MVSCCMTTAAAMGTTRPCHSASMCCLLAVATGCLLPIALHYCAAPSHCQLIVTFIFKNWFPLMQLLALYMESAAMTPWTPASLCSWWHCCSDTATCLCCLSPPIDCHFWFIIVVFNLSMKLAKPHHSCCHRLVHGNSWLQCCCHCFSWCHCTTTAAAMLPQLLLLTLLLIAWQ